MMGMSAKRGHWIRQVDLIIAFFYKIFDEQIYIIQLTIFEYDTTQVYFLKKALYSLK